MRPHKEWDLPHCVAVEKEDSLPTDLGAELPQRTSMDSWRWWADLGNRPLWGYVGFLGDMQIRLQPVRCERQRQGFIAEVLA